MSGITGALRADPEERTIRVNDVHSGLNATGVRALVSARRPADVTAAIDYAGRRELPLAVSGGRHAMGGQQFATGGFQLDMSGLDRVIDFDPRSGLIEVEAGIQWPALQEAYLAAQVGMRDQWCIRQKQTGADRLSIGGALAANIHGRVLASKPIIEDVVAFTMVDAQGHVVRCSRDQNTDLFRLAIGGYGLFGVILTVTLQLVPQRKLQRVVDLRTIDELAVSFAERIDDGYLYGDLQFVTDENSADFLRRGIFSCYRPVANDMPIPDDQVYMTEQGWQELLYLAHVDKGRAFDRFSRFYLGTSGQYYWTDTHQFTTYLDDYHTELDGRLHCRHPGSEMITELYVPSDRLVDFMQHAAETLRSTEADLIYGTIRLIRRDDESFLAWADQDYACVIFNLHVEHTADGVEKSRRSFIRLIEDALNLGGSFFLTYHRHASAEQVTRAYPKFEAFLEEKRRRDPGELFASDWYRHYAGQFEASS